jgi:hypothetical protein
MLARLLQVGTLRGAVQRHLALLAATLGADALVEGKAEAFFFAKVADGTAQKSTSVAGRFAAQVSPLWHFRVPGDSCTRMDVDFSSAPVEKPA